MPEYNKTYIKKTYVIETAKEVDTTILRFLSESELERINQSNANKMALFGIEFPLVGIADIIENTTKEELISIKTVKAYEDTGNH